MKKIFSLIVSMAMVAGIFSSCETYSVDDPDMTAVSDIDGEWVAFGINQEDPTDTALFYIQITNTTKNASDSAWITVTDLNLYIYRSYCLDAVRFKTAVNGLSFTFNDNTATEPKTCRNPYYEQSYYTYAGRYNKYSTYTIAGSGEVTLNVDSPSGYKTSAIKMIYSRTYPDGTVEKYNISGIKNTGWAEDTEEYANFAIEQGWW